MASKRKTNRKPTWGIKVLVGRRWELTGARFDTRLKARRFERGYCIPSRVVRVN